MKSPFYAHGNSVRFRVDDTHNVLFCTVTGNVTFTIEAETPADRIARALNELAARESAVPFLLLPGRL